MDREYVKMIIVIIKEDEERKKSKKRKKEGKKERNPMYRCLALSTSNYISLVSSHSHLKDEICCRISKARPIDVAEMRQIWLEELSDWKMLRTIQCHVLETALFHAIFTLVRNDRRSIFTWGIFYQMEILRKECRMEWSISRTLVLVSFISRDQTRIRSKSAENIE